MSARREGLLIGRGWALDRIRGWLDSTEPALLITGSPGTGKTALVTGLPRARVHATHLCRSHVTASTDPVRVLSSIAHQLSRSVPGYAVRSAPWRCAEPDQRPEQAAQLVLDRFDATAAYDQVLRHPLAALASGRGLDRDVVVVIDGLDESDAGTRPSDLAKLLADRLVRRKPGPGLRLLLTARPGPSANLLHELATFDLTADAPPRTDDVRGHLDARSALPLRHRKAVAAAAAGNHVYADVAARLAAAGRTGVLTGTPAEPAEPAESLGALYERALADLGGPESLTRRVLALLARARDRGLTANQLAEILGESRERIDAALTSSHHLLTGTRWLRVHHRCLADHIINTDDDPGAAHWAIARSMARQLARAPKRRAEAYAARNLLVHLANVESAQADQALATCLTDPAFFTAALSAVGVDDLLSASAYVNRRRRSVSGEADALTTILSTQAPTVRAAREDDDPTLATQQLQYEAATIGEIALARRLATCLGDEGILTLWATRPSPLTRLAKGIPGHAAQVTHIMVTADGTRAVSASADGTPRVWRLASGRVAQTMPKTGQVSALFPTPDESHVVAATTDGQAQVWNTERGEPVAQLTALRTAMVTAFAVSPGGTRAISGDLDGHVTVWDLTTGEPDLRLPYHAGFVTAVAITPDTHAAAAGGGDILVWDLAAEEQTARLTHDDLVTALALTPTADRVLVGDSTGFSVYALTGAHAGQPVHRLVTHHSVTALAVNPAMPDYALLGTAFGQVAYVRLGDGRPAAASGRSALAA